MNHNLGECSQRIPCIKDISGGRHVLNNMCLINQPLYVKQLVFLYVCTCIDAKTVQLIFLLIRTS